jgi:hypothetical protein
LWELVGIFWVQVQRLQVPFCLLQQRLSFFKNKALLAVVFRE